jgi:putative transposase
LYRAKDGRTPNADINGAGNTIRKVAPDAFGPQGVEDSKAGALHSLVVYPRRIDVLRQKPKREILARYKTLEITILFGTMSLALSDMWGIQ